MYYEILVGLDKDCICSLARWLNLFNGIRMLEGETKAEI